VLFFAFYLAVTVLFARRRDESPAPMSTARWCSACRWRRSRCSGAWCATCRSAWRTRPWARRLVYLLLAWWLKRQDRFTSLLGQSFVALAVVFATLAIPFASTISAGPPAPGRWRAPASSG
jgi:hypothetical protein